MPGGAVTLEVEEYLKLRDEASKGIEKVKKHAESAAEKVEELKERVEGLASRGEGALERLGEVAGTVGAAFGAWKIAEKFVETNAEAEELERRLGAVLAGSYQFGKASPTENLERGLERSKALMGELAEKSVKLGIPKAELAEVAAILTTSLAKAQQGTRNLVPLTTKLALLARVSGTSYAEAAQQVSMAIDHGAARHSRLLTMLGVNSRQLQMMTPGQRLSMIDKRLSAFQPEELAKMRTFRDVVGSIRATVEETFEAAGRPFFEHAKGAAERLAGWLEKNRDRVEEVGRIVGEKLSRGMDVLERAASFLAEHWNELKAAVEATAIILATHKGFGVLRDLGRTTSAAVAAIEALGKRSAAKEVEDGASRFGRVAATAMKVGLVAEAAGIGWAIGSAIGDYLDKQGFFTPGTSDEEDDASDAEEDRQRRVEGKYAKITEQLTDLGGATAANLRRLEGGEFTKGVLDMYAQDHGLSRVPGTPGAPDERAKVQQNFFNPRFEITQEFAAGSDPDRIIDSFGSDLASLADRPLQSGLSPLFAVG